MKYNSDLANKILSYLEEASTSHNGKIVIEGYTSEEISYHIKKLTEEGLVAGKDASGFGGIEWLATDLTSSGHKYLKEIKNKSQTISEIPPNMQTEVDSRKVFVVHGRNSEARKALFSFLRSIGLHPIEWSEALKATGKASPYVGEILDAAFSNAQAVIVLFTPDDEARLLEPFVTDADEIYEKDLTPQARQNVLFEAGMAMGRSPERTVLVELGKLRPFSDVYGRHVIRLNNSTQKRQELAHRLETAGCAINLVGTDWHTEGHFDYIHQIQTNNQQIKNETVKDILSKDEVKILLALSELSEWEVYSKKNLQEILQMNIHRLSYHLSTLEKNSYILRTFSTDFELVVSIGEKGKEYLVLNDLI